MKPSPTNSFLAILVALLSFVIYFAIQDGRYILDVLNRNVFPKGPSIISNRAAPWRATTRHHTLDFRKELDKWERGNTSNENDQHHCFPEFGSLTPEQYFPEAHGTNWEGHHDGDQKRQWGFLWLRLYGLDTKLAKEFPTIMSVYDSLPVEIYSIGISMLDPGRGDFTHYGEFRGTWRQLLTLEAADPDTGDAGAYLGIYPHALFGICDSIWTSPQDFQNICLKQNLMRPPLIHRYQTGEDILWDDSVWHFIDNDTLQRRVALWIDVIRTDLNLVQRIVLRIFMFLATYANDEVYDTVAKVNSFDYESLCSARAKSSSSGAGVGIEHATTGHDSLRTEGSIVEELLDSAPKGPQEDYERSILAIPDEDLE